MPKISIVIPTYGDRAYDLLEPCLRTIHEYTDLSDTEIIVVANGCTESTREVCSKYKLTPIWYDEALGYARACNKGMEVSLGDYIVLLNNDIELLPQPKSLWIDMLLRAFWDERVAISGPMMSWCPYAEYEFLIGFCTMFRKEALNQIGHYDESFEAYGEDCAICVEAQLRGWKIKQVPDDTIRRLDGQPSVGTGNFPMWHKGNESYRNWPGGEELLRKNREILRSRYATGIGKAYECDGYMSPAELRWLAAMARKSKTIVQLGAWHGRSSRAIADNLQIEATFYDIDTWRGSKSEQDNNHASAQMMEGDHAFDEYARNLWDRIEEGRVLPIRMNGANAAKLLADKGVKADWVFIDGGHDKGETKADIESFLPLLKPGGVIAGHDYMHEDGMWPAVGPEVKEIFGKNIGQPEGTHIWYTDSIGGDATVGDGVVPLTSGASKVQSSDAPRIYDCFQFFNELEILEIRFNELYETVDRFVIVEATKTHQGNPKPLYFKDNLQRFEKFLDKVTHIVTDFPDEMEVGGGPCFPSGMNWARERHQREAIMQGLTECKDNDICIVSDADEIPSEIALLKYQFMPQQLMRMEMSLWYYYLNCYGGEWREAKILPYAELKRLGPCNTRYSLHTIGTHGEPLWNAGWHFSFCGGTDRIVQKIQSYGHGEYNRPDILDRSRIEKAVAEGKDVYGRDEYEYRFTDINGQHPKYVQENVDHFREIGFVK